MKKILSILLSLAMLVSMAALTTTPVTADTTHTTEECVCPELIPLEGEYDLSVPAPVAVNIILHTATNLTNVTDAYQNNLPGGSWVVYSNSLLVITVDYLKTVLKDHDDCVILIVHFDYCKVNFKITAKGKDSTLIPSSRNWVVSSTASVNTTIQWGCQWNNITNIRHYKNPSNVHPYGYEDLAYGTEYTLGATNTDTNSALLTITNSYLLATLFNLDDVIKLEIDFECSNNATFTIKGVKTPTPDVSPRAVPYNIGCLKENLDSPLPASGFCCYNVCTQIIWNNVADTIVSVKDITNQQSPSTLILNQDYWVSANNETLILNGCLSGSASWGGLVTRLDACSRLARLIAVTFNDACNTTVILTVNSAGYTAPSMTPTAIVVDVDAAKNDPLQIVYSYSGSVVSLGSALCIANVTDITVNPCTGTLMYPTTGALLVPPLQWMLSYVPAYGGSLLLLSRKYYVQAVDGVLGPGTAGANITALNSTCHTLLIRWLPDNLPAHTVHESTYPNLYCPTKITICPTGIGATICPNKADFNIDEVDDPIYTEITWGNWATNVTAVWATKCSVPVLEWGTDYILDHTGNCLTPSILTITDTYLNKVLKKVGDQIVLNIKFDQGADQTLTITATGAAACFIATAAGADAPQLDILRAFRDSVLRGNALGRAFISAYYTVSPSIAKFIAGNDVLKKLVMDFVVDPAVSIAQWVMG